MKIKQLIIKNFRGISDMSISPEHLNFFIGPCGSGKTSILKAIDFVLTGNVKEDDIREGCPSASVTLEWIDGSSIERKRDRSGTTVKCNGKKTTAKALKEFLENKLNTTNVDIYEAMLNVDYFTLISQRDLTELFLSILPVQINFEKMCEFIEAFNKKPLTDKEKDFLQNVFPAMPEIYGLEAMDSAYLSLYNDRRGKNAVLKNLLAKAVFDESKLPKESKEDLEVMLFELAKKESDVKAYQKNLDAYNKSVAQQDAAKKKLDWLNLALKEYEAIEKPDAAVLETAKKEKKQFEEVIVKYQTSKTTHESNLTFMKRTLKSLNTSMCPISSKLVCTTDKSGLKGEYEEQIAKTEKAIAEHIDFLNRCKEQVTKRDLVIEQYNQNVLKFTQKSALEKQIQDFVIPEVLEKPVEIKADGIMDEKKDVNVKLQTYAAYEASLKAKEEAVALQEELSLHEFALQCLDVKSGVRSFILEKVLASFVALCNQKAREFNKDMEIDIKNQDGIQFLLKTKNSGNFIPMKKASSGEFVFIIYLMTNIINQVTNAKYLIIDNLDKLDAESMNALRELLEKDSGYDHIFVGAVNHDDTIRSINSGNNKLTSL